MPRPSEPAATSRCASLLLLLAIAGCSFAPDRPENLIVISIDTLRADHLGVYGHPWVKTPHIDALAGEAVRFERAVTPVPTTLASHTSLMTGTYPHSHGVPDNDYRVAEANLMLAEILGEHGFATSGVIGGYPLGPQTRFNQGFASYTVLPSERPNSGQVSDAALAWLDRREDGRFFLFVHYWDVHWPYSPPPPYARMYRRDELPMVGLYAEIADVRRRLRRREPGAAERSQVLRALYAGGVTWVDFQVGRLLAGLSERGLLDRSLLVLTADHGEAMDENPGEYWNHGFTVYDSVARVPLLLRLPRGAGGGRVEDWRVSSVDLMPTMLELLGLPVPARVEGESYAGALLGREAWIGRSRAYAQATKPHDARHEAGRVWRNADKCRAVWEQRWKLQHCPLVPRSELYDLSRDPGEQRNLLGKGAEATARQTARRLSRELTAWSESARPLKTIAESSPEVIQQLRALGYVEDPSSASEDAPAP